LISFILLWLCGLAQATDYYVSPSGSDSYSGTSPSQAWKTISKVNGRAFAAGDRIFFEGGQTFSGSLYFDTGDGGTPANPLTISSYGTGRATISSGNSRGFFAYNRAAFVITNLNFVGSGRTDTTGSDGILFYTDLAGGVKLQHVRIDNVDVSGYRETAIQIGGWHSSNSGFKNVRITNAIVHDNGDKGISSYGYWPPSGWAHQDIYVGDCKVYNNAGNAGKTGHTGNGIVLSSVNGAIIEFCEAYNNGWLCDYAYSGGPVGIWAWDANNVVIQFCESYENKTDNDKDGGGFDLDGGAVNSVMQYNYSHDNYGAGYLICQFDGARTFRNNTCRFNVSENDGYTGGYGAVTFWSSGSNGGIQDTYVYNNTLYVGPNTTGHGIDVGSGAIYNTYIYNNIIVTVPNKRVVNMSSTSGGWYFKGNCYWTYGDNIEIKWGGTTYTSLAAWRSATGQEKLGGNNVGFECDPCLVDVGNGGTIGDPCNLAGLTAYKLQGSSPLINAALDIQSLFGIDPGLRDYYGTSIPRCYQFDVGAHEFYFSPADFDCDEAVDFSDYARLAGAWMTDFGEPDFNDIYDLNNNDTVDMPDIGIFSEEWLQ